MKPKATLTLSALMLAACISASGQKLVYKPINPAFGGDTFNYQWLLNSADVQNVYKEKTDFSSILNQDPQKQFEQNLNNQILSELSRRLVANVFGESGVKDGTFELGGFQIQVNSGSDGVHINILNVNNGGQTAIVVPYF